MRYYFSGTIQDNAVEEDYWASYHGWVRTALAGKRRLITTKAGRIGWIESSGGLAPSEAEARPGDVFAVFPGCTTPMLLRTTDKQRVYKVMGEAYVHGIMTGEACELLAANECSLEKIWLC